LYRTDEDIQKEEAKRKELDFEDKLIQSTTEVLSGTTNYLGSVLSKGVNKLQQVDVDEIVAQADKVGKSTLERGQQFMAQTADTLGVVTGRAKGMWEESNGNSPKSQPNAESAAPAVPPKPTFSYNFDEFMGNVHLQALELLSTECTMKVQGVQRKCESDSLQNLVIFLQMISEVFEGEAEEAEFDEPELSEKVLVIKQHMDKLHKDVEPIIQSLIQEFKDSIQSLSKNEKAEESEEGASSFNEIANTFESCLGKIHQEELKLLAQLAASSVELLNRIMENWIVQSQQQNEEDKGDIVRRPEISLNKARYIESQCNILADEISAVSMNFVQACRTVSSHCCDVLNDQKIAETVLQTLRNKSKTQINTIYADTGDAIAKVHDSKEFSIPILQWIYVLSESQLTTK